MANEKFFGKLPIPTESGGSIIPPVVDGPLGNPPPVLTPSKQARLERLLAAFDRRMALENEKAAKLGASGYDYRGREQITNLMRRLGRA